MEELKQSTKWVPSFIEIERIKKEALKLGEKKGRKEGKKIGMEKGIEKGIKMVAKSALKKGTAIDYIAEITGLSIEEIKKIK